jgi:hypothetical protein
MNKVVVHTFRLGDVEDPELYAAQPLYEWELSEHGQWVMEHSRTNPLFNIRSDVNYMGYEISIVAELSDEDTTYHLLKWGGDGIRHTQ